MQNISKKEWWIGLVVALFALSVATLFEPTLKDGLLKDIRTYQQALQINNDPKMYTYAQTTNVGNVLAYGNLTALDPVSIPELKQTYGAILKVKEHYTMHTREVCKEYAPSSNNGTPSADAGKCIRWETEEYWTWDTVGSWLSTSSQFNFLGVTFSHNQLELPQGQFLTLDSSTVSSAYDGLYDSYDLYTSSLFGVLDGNDRYYFKVVPISFACTIFSKFVGDTISDPITGSTVLRVQDGMTPAQIIEKKKADLIFFDVAYFSIWVLLCVGIWYWISYEILDLQ